MGVKVSYVTLHVALGTFESLASDWQEKSELHQETFFVSAETAKTVNEAKESGHSVFAVGTTVVRSLESAACDDGKLNSVFSDTSLFIKPGYSWKVVDKLVTNFHLPQTSLLLLVSSFATPDLILGIEELIDRLVKEIPAPNGDENAPLQALVFDSFYDTYKGVVSVVRIFNGQVRVGDRIRFWASGLESEVTEVGVFSLKMVPTESLEAGDVGYVAANIRDIREVPVGDTMTSAVRPADAPIPGFSAMKPMVFASIYPTENEDFERLRESLKKLQLNDAALVFEPESSEAFGPGFRCGFLGLLHMDIIRERLEREFDLDLILTSPNVEYHVLTRSGEYIEVRNPSQFPDFSEVELVEEPYVRGTVVVPSEYVGSVIQLCEGRRGKMLHMEYISQQRVLLEYDLPFAEIITDFYDQLKSVTRGYASFDYEHIGFKEADVDKIEVFINGKKLDALTLLAPKSEVLRVARQVASNLKHTIPKQLVEVVIQVKAGGRIVARETIKPLRKDVLAKCYGGDVSRKKKLLEKQKAGKKRMRQFNQVDIPQEAFLSVLKADTE